MKIGVLHVSPVDKEILVATFLLCALRRTNKSFYGAQGCLSLYWHQLLIDALAEDIADALMGIGGLEMQHLHTIAVEREGDVRINQCYAFKCLNDIVHLCGI